MEIFETIFPFAILLVSLKTSISLGSGNGWAVPPMLITNLASNEYEIHSLALKYLKSMKVKIKILNSWIEDYNASTISASNRENDTVEMGKTRKVVAHALMTYRMMRRFAYNLKDIIAKSSESRDAELFLEKMEELKTKDLLPNSADVRNIMDSLLNLQNVYDLKSNKLMKGVIGTKKTRTGLTSRQSFDIGKRALDKKLYTGALDWMKSVIRKINLTPDTDLRPNEVLPKLRQLIEEHNAFHDTIHPDNYYSMNLNRFHSKIATNYSLESEKSFQLRNVIDPDFNKDTYGFMSLCKGSNFQTDKEKSKLYCWFELKSDKAWRINPLKIEVHSWDPYLIQIYDVLGEKLMKYLKESAEPLLRRSTVLDYNRNAFGETSAFRISTDAYLIEEQHPKLENFKRTIGRMVGLQVQDSNGVRASEYLQISSYTFGGQFWEHLDGYQLKKEPENGNRIATFMVYLNDVDLGGFTAFSEIGTAIAPVKGSAIFWYNLKRNGKVDDRTLHGGCPVLLGEKWIATKWILSNSNFQKRKCSLNRWE